MSHSEREALAFAGIEAAIDLAHETASKAGWYVDPVTGQPKRRPFPEVVALMHSELSEALEADRKGLMDDKLPERSGVEVELADLNIRIFDTAKARGNNLAGAFIEVNLLLSRFSLEELRFALILFHTFAAARAFGLDLPGATLAKNRFNQERADHKLENRAADGGKKY